MKVGGFKSIIKHFVPGKVLIRITEYRLSRKRKKIISTPFFQVYKQNVDVRFVNSRSRISFSRRYIYFRVPKAANSTVISSIMENEGVNIDNDTVENFKKTSTHLAELPQSILRRGLTDFFKFTVVRNPYSRLYSAYLDKVRRKKTESLDIYKFLKKTLDQEISFDEFLFYLESGGVDKNPHWARQVDLIGIPYSELDFIGKVETLAADLPYIMRKIYGEACGIIEFRPHKTGADNFLSVLLNSELERIYTLYKKDFDAFDYEK